MNNSIVVGIDIGGSHISAALVNLTSRSLLPDSYARKQVDSQSAAHIILDDWCEVIEKAISHSAPFSGCLGIAIPGPFNYEEGISYIKGQNKYEFLYNLNLKNLLAEKLSLLPQNIRFMNDAGCFLQGELFGGAAKGYARAIGLTLGTGLGSARCVGDKAEDADLWNSPFLDGIAEDYLSTRWFVKRCEELLGIHVNGVKELAEMIPDVPGAKQIFEEFGVNAALFLTSFIESDKPDTIVLGGNIVKAHSYFMPKLKRELANRSINLPIHIANLGEEAALVGAASTWSKNRKEVVVMK